MRTFKAVALVTLGSGAALHAQNVRKSAADSVRFSIAGEVSYVDFGGSIDPWRLASLSVQRDASSGSIIGRANYANRFSTSGVQMEADAYPHIGAKTYAYLNAGYSVSEIFPKWRFGAEIFRNLPRAWEASVGFRELRFDRNPVTLVTGTLGKYFGNYWVSARPFVHLASSGNEVSTGVTGRRYFADADHFVGVRASYGSAPSDEITPDRLNRTRSYSADVHGSGGPWRRAVATWSVGVAHEELSLGQTRKSWTLTAGTKIRF